MEVDSAFSAFVSRLDMAEARIWEFKDRSIEGSQIEMQR